VCPRKLTQEVEVVEGGVLMLIRIKQFHYVVFPTSVGFLPIFLIEEPTMKTVYYIFTVSVEIASLKVLWCTWSYSALFGKAC